MSLMTLLMVIVWTMFDVYTKLEMKGVAAAEESGLVRAIDRQLRKDLLHIVAIDEYRGTSVTQETGRSAGQFASNGYLVGSSTDLHFVVSVEPPTPVAADLIRVISYQPRLMVEDESTETDPALDSSLELEDSFVDEFDTPLGIDRRVRSWRIFSENRTSNESLEQILSTGRPISLNTDDFIQVGKTFGDDQSEVRRLVEAEETIDEIPEIQRLSFRYFDGSSWTSQWDSTIVGRLPLAIEVGFSVEAVREEPLVGKRVEEETGQEFAFNETSRESTVGSIQINPGSIESTNETDQAMFTEYRFIISIPAATQSSKRAKAGNDQNQDAGFSDSRLETL